MDSQDPSRSVHLSAEERHLKNEPQLKSTIINALNLCSIGLNAAIIHLEAMRFDVVLLIYQMCTINHHFLTIDLLWNHEITKANKRTDYENERELRRHLEYEEARERRAKIEARREQRTEQTQEIAVEMKALDSVRDQALKGEFGNWNVWWH